jgi:hypothetical protein
MAGKDEHELGAEGRRRRRLEPASREERPHRSAACGSESHPPAPAVPGVLILRWGRGGRAGEGIRQQ